MAFRFPNFSFRTRDNPPANGVDGMSASALLRQELYTEQAMPDALPDPDFSRLLNHLADPQYIKDVGIPQDAEYQNLALLLFGGQYSDPYKVEQCVVALVAFFRDTQLPFYSLLRLSSVLKTVVGNRVSAYARIKGQSMQARADFEQKSLRLLYSALIEIQKDTEAPYLLTTALHPDVVMKPYEPFEKRREALIPRFINNNFAVTDSGLAGFKILYVPDAERTLVDEVINRYAYLLDLANPHTRPPFPDGGTLEEMREYDRKYRKPVSGVRLPFGLPPELERYILTPEQVQLLFPHMQPGADPNTDDLLFEMRTFFNPSVQSKIAEDFQIDFCSLSLQEQLYFMTQVGRTSVGHIPRLQAFVNNFGYEGLRSFLSLAHGNPETAQHIFAIAEKLPESSAKTVFKTYGEIVGAVDQVVDILGDQAGATPELLQAIQTNLYHQGVRLLGQYGAEAAMCTARDCEDLGRKLEERLALAKSSVFAMGAVTRQLVKEDTFDFEKFSQVDLVQETPPISDEFARQMRLMHQANTDQYPEELKQYWRDTLAKALESQDAEQKFVYVKMGDDVLAVMRVIDQDDTWYGASFNVNPTIQGSRVGSELLKKVIADMGSQKPFVADVYAKNPMLKNYLDTFGFIITSTDENYHNTGAKVHEITWTQPE